MPTRSLQIVAETPEQLNGLLTNRQDGEAKVFDSLVTAQMLRETMMRKWPALIPNVGSLEGFQPPRIVFQERSLFDDVLRNETVELPVRYSSATATDNMT